MFELGKEAIGYDSIDEAVELCRYYLEHEEERREIAGAGWRRAMSDYNEISTFRSIMRAPNASKSIGRRFAFGSISLSSSLM